MDQDGVFGEEIARTYDARHSGAGDVEVQQAADRLAALAGGGRALEFAIGTGRIALPLAARGTEVAGIELSAAMVARLRGKPGGAAMEVAIGDMTTAEVAGPFSLVFLVYNTIDNLTTQAAQVACFANAARHLAPGGRFLVETAVPPLRQMVPGQRRIAFARDDDHWGIDEIDTATQTYSSHHMWLGDGDPQALAVPFRYAWPAEMDLMAQMAGMALEHRWEDWTGGAFTDTSTRHISVWRRSGAGR